jgi:hypothetical protein
MESTLPQAHLRNLQGKLENDAGQPPLLSNASMTCADHDVTMESTLLPALPDAPLANEDPEETSPHPSVTENNGQSVAASFQSGEDHPTRRRQKHVSYAKKFFYGASSMYYKPKDGCPLPATLPELIGQITACPNKENDQGEVNPAFQWFVLARAPTRKPG